MIQNTHHNDYRFVLEPCSRMVFDFRNVDKNGEYQIRQYENDTLIDSYLLRGSAANDLVDELLTEGYTRVDCDSEIIILTAPTENESEIEDE